MEDEGGKFEYIGALYIILVWMMDGSRGASRKWQVVTALAIAIAFVALNARAYDGYFQDDELDTLTWAPSRQIGEYLRGLVSPAFNKDNFRPVGHAYFTLMGRAFGLNFPPWITPLFVIHLLNGALVFFILRRLKVDAWRALASVGFFLLSAAALDAYWKPMYVFDLLCATFSLACILAYMHRRWVVSFLAFWLAYKAKEMAVMLPAVLLVYEHWMGERKYPRLAPFLLVSLSFGLQGIFLNPNKDNDYTFRFTLAALARTVPFYFERLIFVPAAVIFIRDKRVGFSLAAMLLLMIPLLFLPGRLFEAYAYLPLACGAMALGVAATHVNPKWIVIALLLWAPFNLRQWRRESRATLAADDRNFAFVDAVMKWGAEHPAPDPLVYTGVPVNFHSWGVTAAWIIAHNRQPVESYYFDSAEGRNAIEKQTVVLGSWKDGERLELAYHLGQPIGQPKPAQTKP